MSYNIIDFEFINSFSIKVYYCSYFQKASNSIFLFKTIDSVIILNSSFLPIFRSEAHIPYRNSPLTKILRSSLGGNSRTAIVLCINPCISQFEQTMSTLRFGLNAKKVENRVRPNIINNINDEVFKSLLCEYDKKINVSESK